MANYTGIESAQQNSLQHFLFFDIGMGLYQTCYMVPRVGVAQNRDADKLYYITALKTTA